VDSPPLGKCRTGDAAGHPYGFGDGPALCETIGCVVKWYIIVRSVRRMNNDRVFQMDFGKVYGLLLDKAGRKGRTKAEVEEVICWLTGYSPAQLEAFRSADLRYGDFFRGAPRLNPNRTLIKGAVCGVRVEEVEDPLMREIRYLDKLIDELAKGKPMEKILRGQEETAMWVCPKCGRSFKNAEQSHYCGEPPATIEEYIAAQPEAAREYLRQVNAAIRASVPEARKKISWSMPTYWKGRNLIQFAAFKRHIGLYPGPEAVEAFAGRLTEYKTSKGTIQLPYNKPLPLELIAEMAKWCEENS
jgi:uncharacterized protein YdhG (YjbR/CyaY superfamily)